LTQGSDKLNLRLFTFAFVGILLINVYVFRGMFHSLAFAAITAGTFYPLYQKIKNRFKLSDEVSAAIVTTIILVILVIPIIFIILQVSKETVGLYSSLRSGLSMAQVKDFLFGDGPVAKAIMGVSELTGYDINLNDLYSSLLMKAQSYSGKVFGTVNSWVGDTISFIFNFLIMNLACFTIFVEGEKMKAFFFRLSPLPDEQEQQILEKFSQMNDVTLICNGIGGIIQGLLGGLGLWFVGFESIFLWSTVMVILAFIPLLGISIVTVPATIYLFATGRHTAATVFFLYTSAVALIVENWFKPKFMGKKIKVNSLLLLFYIIAGMGTFGMAGIFYGPLICIIFLTMVEIFQDYYLPKFS
jgi:predicted PurR-regulated permease PerM